jgi:hypothetical protein
MRALDQEPLILEPLEGGLSAHDGAGKLRAGCLGGPRVDQPLPALKFGVLSHPRHAWGDRRGSLVSLVPSLTRQG